MVIECGSPFKEKRHFVILSLFFLGFCGWFAYDGAIGYPAKNLAEARRTITDPAAFETIAQKDSPNEDDTRDLVRNRPPSVRAVREQLGEPTQVETTAAGDTVLRWGSRYGRVIVSARGEAVSDLRWEKWYKDRSEVRAQLYIAAFVLFVSLFPLWRLISALRLRVRLDDTALNYDGRVIPLNTITAMRDPKLKGRTDIVYEVDGRERTLRLDNLKVEAYEKIIERICELRDLPNPLKSEVSADESA